MTAAELRHALPHSGERSRSELVVSGSKRAQAHGELKLIPIEAVTCFRADQKYVAVDHDGGRDLIDDSLKSLEAEFGDRFVRVHRGALVAVDRIQRIDKNAEGKNRVVLRDDSQVDDEELIISRRHVAEVKRRLKES